MDSMSQEENIDIHAGIYVKLSRITHRQNSQHNELVDLQVPHQSKVIVHNFGTD